MCKIVEKIKKDLNYKKEELGDFADLELAMRRFEYLFLAAGVLSFIRAVMIYIANPNIIKAYIHGKLAYMPAVVSEYASITRIALLCYLLFAVTLLVRISLIKYISLKGVKD